MGCSTSKQLAHDALPYKLERRKLKSDASPKSSDDAASPVSKGEAQSSRTTTTCFPELEVIHESSLGSSIEGQGSQVARQLLSELLTPHDVRPWSSAGFAKVELLQHAVRNRGVVEKMVHREDGHLVAVKRMPNSWMMTSHAEFELEYPESKEQPWVDVGFLRYLQQRDFPYSCKLEGIFSDDARTYVATSLGDLGDLFSWCPASHLVGAVREAKLRPLMAQLCTGVQMLHNHGIAHRDISLENIVLKSPEPGSGSSTPQVKIIDFGMASFQQHTARFYGKPPYAAPESRAGCYYDSFASDNFAVGVVTFCLALNEYPWVTTFHGECKRYDCYASYGIKMYLEMCVQYRDQVVNKEDVISDDLLQFLAGMLEHNPEKRASVGEACYSQARPSVWDFRWLVTASM